MQERSDRVLEQETDLMTCWSSKQPGDCSEIIKMEALTLLLSSHTQTSTEHREEKSVALCGWEEKKLTLPKSTVEAEGGQTKGHQ